MSDVQWREIDFEALQKRKDPEAEYTGPGSGFVPYRFSNGRAKYDGHHRRTAPRAADKGVERRPLWDWDLEAKKL